MLPGRLADGKEKPQYKIAAGPLVNKVRNSAGNYDKDGSQDGIVF